jgi:hypothetical protein
MSVSRNESNFQKIKRGGKKKDYFERRDTEKQRSIERNRARYSKTWERENYEEI